MGVEYHNGILFQCGMSILNLIGQPLSSIVLDTLEHEHAKFQNKPTKYLSMHTHDL